MSYTENIIPTMTSNTTPSGVCSEGPRNDSYYVSWVAFDHESLDAWATNSALPAWLQYQFPEEHVVTQYVIQAGGFGYCATAWTFLGSTDGATWATLDTQENITSWEVDERKSFPLVNETSYSYYRLNITASNAYRADVRQLEMMEDVPPSSFAPTVTTAEISDITADAATGGGDVTDDGGATITARGVCWAMATTPTTDDAKTVDEGTTGAWITAITDLLPEHFYQVRAYATNENGTSYGDQIEFLTESAPIDPADNPLLNGTLHVPGKKSRLMRDVATVKRGGAPTSDIVLPLGAGNLVANPSGEDGLTGWWNWEGMRTDRVPSFGFPEGFSTCLSNSLPYGWSVIDGGGGEIPEGTTLLPWGMWVAYDADGGVPESWVIAPQYGGSPYDPDLTYATTEPLALGEWQYLSGVWEVPYGGSIFWVHITRTVAPDPPPTAGFIYVCGVTVGETRSIHLPGKRSRLVRDVATVKRGGV